MEFAYQVALLWVAFAQTARSADSEFVPCLYLKTEEYRKHIRIRVLAGSRINNLTPGSIERYSTFVPSNRVEQTAIANILSDMDAEITALEAKLSKAHQIKQGMMQELLTGRIRLL